MVSRGEEEKRIGIDKKEEPRSNAMIIVEGPW